MRSTGLPRWRIVAGIMVAVIGSAASTQAAGAELDPSRGAAPPATLVPSLVKPPPVSSTSDGRKVKNATVRCPAGMRALGGGAKIEGANIGPMKLTHMYPFEDDERGYYAVTAEAPTMEYTGNWYVTAYALCAYPPDGYEILPRRIFNPTSRTFHQAEAVCPSGKRVIGTGASVTSGGRIGLQLTRASAPLDIARATAREDADGYGPAWNLTSFAICTNPLGARASYAGGTSDAVAGCPSGRVHGTGGGGPLTDIGPVFLRAIEPQDDLRRVSVTMSGPVAGGMVAQAICA